MKVDMRQTVLEVKQVLLRLTQYTQREAAARSIEFGPRSHAWADSSGFADCFLPTEVDEVLVWTRQRGGSPGATQEVDSSPGRLISTVLRGQFLLPLRATNEERLAELLMQARPGLDGARAVLPEVPGGGKSTRGVHR